MSLLRIERHFLAKPEKTNRKYIISGPMVEEYLYKEPRPYNLIFDQTKSKGLGVRRTLTPEEELEIQERTGERAKKALRRLVNANNREWKDIDGKVQVQKFLTLTFAENMQDLEKANGLFTDFIKRFNYAVFGVNRNHLKYVAVHEIQKRGAIHYHVIFFNLPYMRNDKIARIWGHGFTKPKAISSIRNVGAYLAKYLSKQGKTARKKGQKRYFSSRGLKLPLRIRNQERANTIAALLAKEKPIYEKESEYHFRYRAFDLSRRSGIRQEVIQCAKAQV